MAKKREEDNRDIFEKALDGPDYNEAVRTGFGTAAIIGGLVGGRIMRNATRGSKKVSERIGGPVMGAVAGGAAGAQLMGGALSITHAALQKRRDKKNRK